MADEKETAKTEEKTEVKAPTTEELMAEIEKLKKAISASNADASKRKKEAEEWQTKYKSTLDEQKRKEFEAEESLKALRAENEQYKSEKRIASYQTKLMSAGFDAQTASTMASILPDGVPDTFFEDQKKYLDKKTQEIKTQMLNSQPGLTVGMPMASSKDAKDKETDDLRRWMGLK